MFGYIFKTARFRRESPHIVEKKTLHVPTEADATQNYCHVLISVLISQEVCGAVRVWAINLYPFELITQYYKGLLSCY